jgi:uncharacterized protein
MNNTYLETLIRHEVFYLLHQKAVFRPASKQLIISDIHLGKATHFRKSGIPMPAQIHLRDIDRLHFILNTWRPESVLLLGDLFHSEYNREWLWFKSVLMEYPEVRFILVAGNHDILPASEYDLPNLEKTELVEEPHMVFTHSPLGKPEKLNVCGHVHPGIRITGVARQSIRLPCFYLSKKHFILPAFGNLTGLQLLEREKNATYYLVTAETIVKL